MRPEAVLFWILFLAVLGLLLIRARLISVNDAPLFENSEASQHADPQGAAHGWAAFSDRGRMPSRKIPERTTPRMCSVGEAVSFAYFSLGQQRKVSRSPTGERKHCTFACIAGRSNAFVR